MVQVVLVNMQIHPSLSLPNSGMGDMGWQALYSKKDFIRSFIGITTGDTRCLKIQIGRSYGVIGEYGKI